MLALSLIACISIKTGWLTCIVCHTASGNTVLSACQCSEAGHEPAISKASLLDIASADIFHKRGLLKNLMYSLDSLGDDSFGAQQSRSVDLKFVAADVVEGVALFVSQIPVLVKNRLATYNKETGTNSALSPEVTYQIPAWVTISHINPLTLLDNLLNFAPALFSRALISFGEKLIGPV